MATVEISRLASSRMRRRNDGGILIGKMRRFSSPAESFIITLQLSSVKVKADCRKNIYWRAETPRDHLNPAGKTSSGSVNSTPLVHNLNG